MKLIIATFILSTGLAFAEPSNDKHQGGPPAEALKACESKTAGTACTFVGKHGSEVAGKCFTPDGAKPPACRPDGAPTNKGEHDSKGASKKGN